MKKPILVTLGIGTIGFLGLVAAQKPKVSEMPRPQAIELPQPLPSADDDTVESETQVATSHGESCGFELMGQLWDAASDKLYSFEYQRTYSPFYPESKWLDVDRLHERQETYKSERKLMLAQSERLSRQTPFYREIVNEFNVTLNHPSLTSMRNSEQKMALFLSKDRSSCHGALVCRNKISNDLVLVTPLVDDLVTRYGADVTRDAVHTKLNLELSRYIFVVRKVAEFEQDDTAAWQWYEQFQKQPALVESVEIDTIALILSDLDQTNYLNQLVLSENRRDFKARSQCLLDLGTQY